MIFSTHSNIISRILLKTIRNSRLHHRRCVLWGGKIAARVSGRRGFMRNFYEWVNWLEWGYERGVCFPVHHMDASNAPLSSCKFHVIFLKCMALYFNDGGGGDICWIWPGFELMVVVSKCGWGEKFYFGRNWSWNKDHCKLFVSSGSIWTIRKVWHTLTTNNIAMEQN